MRGICTGKRDGRGCYRCCGCQRANFDDGIRLLLLLLLEDGAELTQRVIPTTKHVKRRHVKRRDGDLERRRREQREGGRRAEREAGVLFVVGAGSQLVKIVEVALVRRLRDEEGVCRENGGMGGEVGMVRME